MAQHIALTCDWCDLLGLSDEPAVSSRVFALDGAPRKIDLCARCDVDLDRLRPLYERGREIPDDRPKGAASGRRGAAPGGASEVAPPEGRAVAQAPRPTVLCPLPHRSTGGEPMRVTYAHRGNHADMVHGAHIWDIAWGDPDGILTHPCTTHRACLENDLAFTSAKGLTAHINASPLPRVDTDQPVS